ncbi:MAG: hypothetical protein PF518_18325 [Spirochaetaceae bacterium]|jgi:hypothetical protein|nr:hypothetical protein [Spirochaetaceae bacterium]
MKKIIIFFIILTQILSCSEGLYEELIRLSADPEVSVPDVISFFEEGSVRVVWADDILADEYILYRALDGDVLNFKKIYRGRSTEYLDSAGIIEKIYHYSLVKVRGLKEFERSSAAIGVFSSTKEDSFEDNDTKEHATYLEQGLLFTSNLYGYRDSYNSTILDDDWYRIRVPAGCVANVIVRQLIPLATDGAANHFKSYIEGQPSVPVIDGRDINIINGFNENKDFYLKIFPNQMKYFPDPEAGGIIVSYQIFIDKVE